MMTLSFIKEQLMQWPPLVLEKALAIYIYGSVARGDGDADSDCDILVCLEDCTVEELTALKAVVQELQEQWGYEFAFYSRSVLEAMQQKGSYFLWHIKMEGILLYQTNDFMAQLLDTLPPYRGTAEDFAEYAEILSDVCSSITEDPSASCYDLAVLATLARNICIASCYLLGIMDFGRTGPVLKCMQYWGVHFPFTMDEYKELYAYRLADTRGKPLNKPFPTSAFMIQWYKRVYTLLALALTLIK